MLFAKDQKRRNTDDISSLLSRICSLLYFLETFLNIFSCQTSAVAVGDFLPYCPFELSFTLVQQAPNSNTQIKSSTCKNPTVCCTYHSMLLLLLPAGLNRKSCWAKASIARQALCPDFQEEVAGWNDFLQGSAGKISNSSAER